MLDAEYFQSQFFEAVEDQIIFEAIHPPGADVLQVPAAKFPQPTFLWLQCQFLDCAINRLEKTQGGFRIVLAEVMEITGGVQFGIVAD